MDWNLWTWGSAGTCGGEQTPINQGHKSQTNQGLVPGKKCSLLKKIFFVTLRMVVMASLLGAQELRDSITTDSSVSV